MKIKTELGASHKGGVGIMISAEMFSEKLQERNKDGLIVLEYKTKEKEKGEGK
ncbi:MAG: hypothetical protein ACYDG6_06725 [Thermincolia bacterium]